MAESYAEVLLPLPLYSTFTYHIPNELLYKLKVGYRVIVPFGRKKFYTGIVAAISTVAPDGYEVKDIAMILENYPIVKHPQLKFWDWISEYYLCSPGEVYRAAMPAGLKVESETFVELNSDYEESEDSRLSEREVVICQLLDHEGKMSLVDIEKKTEFRNIGAIVARLIEKRL